MFKRMILGLACVAALGLTTLATPDKADAGWRVRSRPYVSVYYGPRYSYYRPYRSYYRSHYRPYYYDPYYGYYGRRYYSYPDYYYYGGPRGRVAFSFGF